MAPAGSDAQASGDGHAEWATGEADSCGNSSSGSGDLESPLYSASGLGPTVEDGRTGDGSEQAPEGDQREAGGSGYDALYNVLRTRTVFGWNSPRVCHSRARVRRREGSGFHSEHDLCEYEEETSASVSEDELDSFQSPAFDLDDEYATTEVSSSSEEKSPEPQREKRKTARAACSSRRVKRFRHLRFAGEFGALELFSKGCLCSANVVDRLRVRETGEVKHLSKVALGKNYLPNGDGEVMATYDARTYSGQFSMDGSLFYSCTQDYLLHLYDTSDTRRIRQRKVIQCHEGRWTITDASLSPNNEWLCYSSITPIVWMVALKMDDPAASGVSSDIAHHENNKHVALNLSLAEYSSASISHGRPPHFGLWSVRFSGNGCELVAGASDANIYVYDIQARRVLHRISGHTEDVNGVSFAEAAATNVLISGSDDTTVKVWDRRSIGINEGEPCGVLVGHTEGVTHVASKGDGRYCLSNGKDQQMKLWDIRMMYSAREFAKLNSGDFRCDWDYRFMDYPGNPRFRHPHDMSVTTARGHTVLKTLIRCGFSPPATTGQAYMYSGSEDGRVHIYDVTGRTVRILDVSKARLGGKPFYATFTDSQVSEPDPWRRPVRQRPVVRDIAWHPYEVLLLSTAWGGRRRNAGSIISHAYNPAMGDSDN